MQDLQIKPWFLINQGVLVGKGPRPLATKVLENQKGAEFALRFWAPRGGGAGCQLWISDPSGKVVATLAPEPMR